MSPTKFEAASDGFPDPGVYRVELTTNGETVVSDGLTVSVLTFVDEVSFRG